MKCQFRQFVQFYVSIIRHSLVQLQGDLRGAFVVGVEEALAQYGPLDGGRGKEEVEAERRVRVTAEERHEESEADEYHHVDILES